MKKVVTLFLFSFLLSLTLISFINANFACGYINNSKDLSAVWEDVSVYYSDSPSYVSHCKVNSENKFCCDLEKIQEVEWAPNKMVSAEVYDKETGYVAGPVSGLTTEEGYFVLPDMQLNKVINFNEPPQTILINKSFFVVNLSLVGSYNNLKYQIENSEGLSENKICEDCTDVQKNIPLEKGKNEITFIAYDDFGKEIPETLNVFSLDYLNIKESFECDRCVEKGNKFYVPSNSEVKLKLELNSSHEISGEGNVLIPKGWKIPEDLYPEDYSDSHSLIIWNLSKNPVTYSLISSETFLKRKDYFRYEIGDYVQDTKVSVYSLTRFFPFASRKGFSKMNYFDKSMKNKGSPTNPIMLDFENSDSTLSLVAIYPKEDVSGANVRVSYNKVRGFFNKNRKDVSFNILSNIPNKEIKEILFRIKVERGKEVSFFGPSGKINLEVYDETKDYIYYQAYYSSKGTFRIKFS